MNSNHEKQNLLSQDQIDEAVLEADEAWRQTGKITRYSDHLVSALVPRLSAVTHAQTPDSMPQKQRLQDRSNASQALGDNTIRVERIVMLDAMLGDHLYPAQALEHLMEEETDTLLSLFPGMPDWLRKALIDNVEFEDAFVEWINQSGLSGFVVQFATPVMKWDASGESSTYSWGHYTTRWLHANSMDEAISMSQVWADSIRQAERR